MAQKPPKDFPKRSLLINIIILILSIFDSPPTKANENNLLISEIKTNVKQSSFIDNNLKQSDILRVGDLPSIS
ncbi:hypothetical protein [Geminocystis sp. GBBB08]|uniref:hypothetical protein n=1 Tax=Geminocystis sp. GBBB08 TaxID=2604140 RepID=UPI0027E2B2F4|nr:hypothetical protein [Geminocystis sp. GBBB08]MBL1210200.1 hypothetical protein [Geminocystis sp. GBBB08]